jgi:hypothetical protein
MRLVILSVVLLLALTPAKAEFVMLSPPDGPVMHDSPAPKPLPIPRPHAPRKHLAPGDPALSGFGDHVPLTFAVRQIVPARFQVAFDDTVDKGAPVDWKGGKPWRATLADAVRPLGLVVSVTGPKVTIAAAPVH